jgi:hypothetical protein
MSWEITSPTTTVALIIGIAIGVLFSLAAICYRNRPRQPSHTPNISPSTEDLRIVEAAERVRHENQQPNARARSGSALLPYPPGGGLGE